MTESPGKNPEVVRLAASPGALAEFLTSLMGEKRTLARNLNCRFEIDHDWLNAYISLIEQRISSQNGGVLTKFSAVLTYENDRSIKMTTKESFFSHHDMSNVLSTQFSILMVYAIRFPDKASPEVQEIVLRGRSRLSPMIRRSTNTLLRNFLLPLEEDKSRLEVLISFTDLSWGEDMLGLIERQVFSSFSERKGLVEGAKVAGQVLTPLIGGIVTIALPLYFLSRSMDKRSKAVAASKDLFSKDIPTIASVEHKVDAIYFSDATAMSDINSSSPLLSLFLPLIVAIVMTSILRISNPSFIIMNKYSRNYAERQKTKRKILYSTLLITLLLSVIAGLFSNAIYARLPSIPF